MSKTLRQMEWDVIALDVVISRFAFALKTGERDPESSRVDDSTRSSIENTRCSRLESRAREVDIAIYFGLLLGHKSCQHES